ncbi:MAG: hypothetical protein ABJA94_04325 [Rhodoglobus sp.]
MNTRRQRIMGAVIASAAIPGLLVGCAPGPKAPSNDEIRASIAAAVEAVPTVTGSLVNVAIAGVGARSLRVKLYVDDVSPTSLAATIDAALKATWQASSFTPGHISISAVDGPKPQDATMASLDGVDLAPVQQALAIEGRLNLGVLTVGVLALSARYGARPDPAVD